MAQKRMWLVSDSLVHHFGQQNYGIFFIVKDTCSVSPESYWKLM